MAKLTASVALCTCNGEKYIREQIQSIIRQSIPVDEIVVCDDISTDGTLAILEKELSSAGIPCRIVVNETRLGAGLNFQKCIGLCRGDIVLLSDQDDVWAPDKVEAFLTAFADERVVCAFSDAGTIDGAGNPLEDSLLSGMVAPEHFPAAFTPEWLPDTMARIRRTPNGCFLAIRREPFLSVLSDPMCSWHDGWLFHAAALVGEYAFINKPLMSYRIHENNLTSSSEKQLEYIAKRDACDAFDRHFELHCFHMARIAVFERALALSTGGNRYLRAYRKAAATACSLQKLKEQGKASAVLRLLRDSVCGLYRYRYHDPVRPAGLRFRLRLLRMLLSDISFLLKR